MLFARERDAVLMLGEAWRWPNFSVSEFSCRCSGRFCDGTYWHDAAFLDALQKMRDDLGTPLRITSGHRCPLWNAAVGGAALSRHKQIAADISLRRQDRFRILDAAESAGFTGLGLARTFLHVDRRAQPAIWYYRGSKNLWQT